MDSASDRWMHLLPSLSFVKPWWMCTSIHFTSSRNTIMSIPPPPAVRGDNKLDLADPKLEKTFRGHRNYVTSVSFSPQLKQLASGSGDNCVMLWNFKPQLRAFRFVGHTAAVTDVKFSPDGDVLASASKDKTVRLWIPNAKGESVTMKGHSGPVRSVNFSADSKYLVTASDDKTAKIWSLPSRKFASSLVSH